MENLCPQTHPSPKFSQFTPTPLAPFSPIFLDRGKVYTGFRGKCFGLLTFEVRNPKVFLKFP